MTGVDPGPLTLRELALMAEGRARLEWAQSSILMEHTYAAVRGPENPARSRDDFNPYAARDKAATEQAANRGPLPKVNFGFMTRKRVVKATKKGT